jgi:hypothetical protein
LSGSPALQFSPSFTAYFATSGKCELCANNPPTYDAIVVVMSDDPNLQRECDSGDAQYSLAPAGYHYLTVEIVSTATLGAGSYPVGPPRGGAAAPSAYVLVGESRPTKNGSTQSFGASGSVQLVQVADLVQGSFTASLKSSGESATAVSLSGSFFASSCPLLFNLASDVEDPSSFYELFQSPCSACPG